MKLKLSLPGIGFNGFLELKKFAYNNNVPALVLFDDEDEEFMTASVNVVEHAHRLGKNQTFIKNWTENEGILEALQAENVIGPVLFTVPCGYTQAQAVEILVNIPKEGSDA